MKNRLFPNITLDNINDSKIMDSLNKYGITIDEGVFFSRVNLLIGKNGSGKTRFLKAIKDIYSTEKSVNVVYAHFPSLSCRLVEGTEKTPKASLYEWKRGAEDAVFDDTFVAIQSQILHFFYHFGNCISGIERNEINKIISEINGYLYSLVSRKMELEDNQFYISSDSNKCVLLYDALAEFSPGELMLLYMIVFLVLQNIRNIKTVIILDEPELHLHHAVLSRVFQSLIKMIERNDNILQLWVATHSLFIVPSLKFKNISLVENSTIKQRNSRLYDNIINQMLGDEIAINDFFAARGWWHYYEYIRECFLDPTVVDIINPKDRQVAVVRNYINDNAPKNVLDIGGGTGRLEYSLGFPDDCGDIQFTIYDKNPPTALERNGIKCLTELDVVDEKYDLVVMMNFLHELDPDKWSETLNKVQKLMMDTAEVLIIEESILTIGERPNKKGYFVFNTDELRILFNNDSIGANINDERTTAVFVPKEDLQNVNSYSIRRAILHLRDRALREVSSYPDVDNARTYAFYLQQYINAKLYIRKSKRAKKFLSKFEDDVSNLNPEYEMSLLRELESQFNEMTCSDENCRKAKRKITDIISVLKKQNQPNNKQCEICWKLILKCEKARKHKKLIALMLLVLTLAKHEKSVRHFQQNRYKSYIPDNILDIVRAYTA